MSRNTRIGGGADAVSGDELSPERHAQAVRSAYTSSQRSQAAAFHAGLPVRKNTISLDHAEPVRKTGKLPKRNLRVRYGRPGVRPIISFGATRLGGKFSLSGFDARARRGWKHGLNPRYRRGGSHGKGAASEDEWDDDLVGLPPVEGKADIGAETHGDDEKHELSFASATNDAGIMSQQHKVEGALSGLAFIDSRAESDSHPETFNPYALHGFLPSRLVAVGA